LNRFIVRHNEGRGLIVKAGYVTNRTRYHKNSIKTVAEVIATMTQFRDSIVRQDDGCYYVPYLIVQPSMINRMEKKLVCMNGRYCYATHPNCSSSHKFRYSGNLELRYKQFAENAIRLLKERVPECIVDGLVRVDIFETARDDVDDDPVWVVNEIETLEAVYSTTEGNEEYIFHSGLADYWASILMALIQDYHNDFAV
jgi:hypothetical protein